MCIYVYITIIIYIYIQYIAIFILHLCWTQMNKYIHTHAHTHTWLDMLLLLLLLLLLYYYCYYIYICVWTNYIYIHKYIYVNIYEQTGDHIPYDSHMMHGFISTGYAYVFTMVIATASTGWHGSPDPDLGPGQRGEDHHPQDHDLRRYLPYHAYTGLQHQEHHAGWLQVETRLKLMFPHDVLT